MCTDSRHDLAGALLLQHMLVFCYTEYARPAQTYVRAMHGKSSIQPCQIRLVQLCPQSLLTRGDWLWRQPIMPRSLQTNAGHFSNYCAVACQLCTIWLPDTILLS